MRPIDADAVVELFEPFADAFTNTEVLSAYLDTLQLISNAPTTDIPTWVPCSERLPSKSGTYLVTYEWVGQSGTKYTEIEVIDFERGRWSDHTRHYEKVTAWMPLPQPYKVGEREGERC